MGLTFVTECKFQHLHAYKYIVINNVVWKGFHTSNVYRVGYRKTNIKEDKTEVELRKVHNPENRR